MERVYPWIGEFTSSEHGGYIKAKWYDRHKCQTLEVKGSKFTKHYIAGKFYDWDCLSGWTEVRQEIHITNNNNNISSELTMQIKIKKETLVSQLKEKIASLKETANEEFSKWVARTKKVFESGSSSVPPANTESGATTLSGLMTTEKNVRTRLEGNLAFIESCTNEELEMTDAEYRALMN